MPFFSDPEVIEFFESKRDLPRATSTSALSSASVLRLLGKVGDTVNKMSSVKMEETDPWYEEKVNGQLRAKRGWDTRNGKKFSRILVSDMRTASLRALK